MNGRVGSRLVLPQILVLLAITFTTGCTKLHLGSSGGSAATPGSGSTGASSSQSGIQSSQSNNGAQRLTAMMTALLHRAPTQAELDALSHLAGDPQKAESAVNVLVRGTERRTTILSSVSQTVVGRAPSSAESTLYLQVGGQPGSPGQREEMVGYLASTDAQTRASSQGMAYVDYVFQQLYNRAPTDLERQEFGQAQKNYALQTVILANTLTPEFSQDWVGNTLQQLGNPTGITSDQKTSYETEIQAGHRFEDVTTEIVAASLPN